MPPRISRGTTLFAVSAVHFLMPFMMSAVGVALPAIGREMGASALQLGLVINTTVTSSTVFLLAMGRLGDIRGRKRIFVRGVALFTLVAGMVSLARSIESVIALQFLQGVGSAMINSTGMAIVVGVFPPKERGRALGITVACVYLGISCGPFLGGFLVTAFGWRSLFHLGFLLGIAVFVLVCWKLRGEWAEAQGEPFDWPGSLLYAAAILMLVTGASSLARGWWAWGLLLGGLGGLGIFGWIETRTSHPVLDVRLLRDNRLFALSNLAALLNYAGTFGVTFYLSLYLQYVKGLSPREAGTILLIQPLAQALLSPLCGRLADRYPPERVATAGMALCTLGLGIAATISRATSLGVLAVMLAVLGIGFALFSSPNTSAVMGSVPARYYGLASGMISTMRSLGMMTSMTIITVILSVFMGSRAVTPETQPAFLHSMRIGLASFCALCAVGIFLSLGRLRPAGNTEGDRGGLTKGGMGE